MNGNNSFKMSHRIKFNVNLAEVKKFGVTKETIEGRVLFMLAAYFLYHMQFLFKTLIECHASMLLAGIQPRCQLKACWHDSITISSAAF
jgi:hypothetical protein